jgi:hypothetical protein
MARLLVEARTAEEPWPGADVPREVLVGVSVSRADDGTPVTGLAVENFRVAAQLGALFGDVPDFAVDQVTEWQWEPDDVEKSGCYELRIGWQPIRVQFRGQPPPPPSGSPFLRGWRFVLGIQVRTFDSRTPPRAVDQGQTIVELISTGT